MQNQPSLPKEKSHGQLPKAPNQENTGGREEYSVKTDAQVDAQIESILSDTLPGKRKKKKGKKRKWILLGVFLLIVVFFGLRMLFGGGAAGIPVEADRIRIDNLEEVLTITGPVEGTDSVDITSGIAAKITELLVKEGDRVVGGVTVLARIDDKDIQKNIANAQGMLDLKIAQRTEKEKNDRNGYGKAKSDLETAQRNYARQAELAAGGAVSQAELEQAQSAVNDARRALSAYTIKDGKVTAGESFDIDIANTERELQNLKDNLENTVLIAPIDGVVTRVNTKVGQFANVVEGKNALITIENLDELQMRLSVSEFSIGKVKLGQKVTISADILGEGNFVEGEVVSISPSGEPKGMDSSERVIPVKVKILDSASGLISGITAKASILLNTAENTMLVPISAIGDDGSGRSVMQFIVPGEGGADTVSIREVETGIEGNTDIELLSIPFDNAEEVRFVKTYNTSLTEGQPVLASLPVPQ